MFPALSSYTAVYVMMGAMLLGAVVQWPRLGGILRHRAYLAVLAALGLLAIPLPFVWHGPDDLLIAGIVLPVLIGVGLVALLEVEPRFGSPLVLGTLSLVGALAAALAGLNDVYIFGIGRAGVGNNPIHYADLSMVLGFFALVGLFGTESRWRLLFLAGPLLGLEAIILSGARGAVLGFAMVCVPVVILMIVWFREIRFWVIGGLVITAIAAGALFISEPGVSNRAMSAFGDSRAALSALFAGQDTVASAREGDYSMDERLALLRGGVSVFLAHPVFGVGAGQIMPSAREYFPERFKLMGNHLHYDLGDFAAGAGVFGLAGYLLLLLAPFLRPSGLYGEARRRAMLLGAVVVSGSYASLGLTNAVFGILPQTALFGTLLAAIVAMGRIAAQGNATEKPR